MVEILNPTELLRAKAAGALVAIAEGLDAAISQLELWGLLKGRAS